MAGGVGETYACNTLIYNDLFVAVAVLGSDSIDFEVLYSQWHLTTAHSLLLPLKISCKVGNFGH